MKSSTRKASLFITWADCLLSSPFLVTLTNDNAEDSEEEGDDLMVHEHESKALRIERTKTPSSEMQPTGRVVGVIKRNWRAYVSFSFCFRACDEPVILA